MKQVMVTDDGFLVEEPLKLYDLNVYLKSSSGRRTKKLNIIHDKNHLE